MGSINWQTKTGRQNVFIPPKKLINVPVQVIRSDLRPTARDAALEPKIFRPGIMTARTLLDGNSFESALQMINVKNLTV